MRIIIDGRMYSQSGTGRYIRNLITHLQIFDSKNEYLILHLKEDFNKLEYEKNFHKILADFKWYGMTEQIRLPGLLWSLMPDIVHFPHFNAPIFYRGKYVVTIHDLIHQHFSMKRATTHGPIVYKMKQWGYKKIFKQVLSKSKAIIVPSNFVKEQLINDCKIARNKIVVTYEAVDDKILLIKNQISKKIPFPYLFYVGNAHPHKNIERLIKAFLILRNKYPQLKLILAGQDHYFWQMIKQEFTSSGIIYAGKISDEELVSFYCQARVFIMPSLEEGFGIPPLEAMACSCPVVSSNAGSLPEICGDAALYFDPLDINNMVKVISEVLDNEKLRKKLIEKGRKRYKEFSWKKLAEQTLEVYQKCV